MHHASATANQSQQPMEICRLVICGDIPGNVVHRLKLLIRVAAQIPDDPHLHVGVDGIGILVL